MTKKNLSTVIIFAAHEEEVPRRAPKGLEVPCDRAARALKLSSDLFVVQPSGPEDQDVEGVDSPRPEPDRELMHLAVERLEEAEIVLLPEGHRWLALPGLDLRESAVLEAVLEAALEPAGDPPWRLHVRHAGSSPAVGLAVFAGLPFGAASPRAAAALGRTDPGGALTIAALPPGVYAIGIPFEGEDPSGESLDRGQLGDRVAWSLHRVEDGGSGEATVPVRE